MTDSNIKSKIKSKNQFKILSQKTNSSFITPNRMPKLGGGGPSVPTGAAKVGTTFATLVRTVGANVSDFVAVEACLRTLFARFGTVTRKM